MLAQRLAELASANAEGLLEYVALTNPLAYFELNHKLATVNIDFFARTCSSDWETRQYRRKPPLSPPPVQVDLAHLEVRVYSWLRLGSLTRFLKHLSEKTQTVLLLCSLKGQRLLLFLVFSGEQPDEETLRPIQTPFTVIQPASSLQIQIRQTPSHAVFFDYQYQSRAARPP